MNHESILIVNPSSSDNWVDGSDAFCSGAMEFCRLPLRKVFRTDDEY